ncbi:MAG TPA: hypothetical protein VFZ00_17890 [Solirubrobacter sp.]|nr:hypothetical protein [Solirubrobacter sp.]
MLDELEPLVGAVPFYGPPIVFIAGPWMLLALLLAAPFAVLMTVVLALIAAGVLIVALAAVIASPYLLVRRLRSAKVPRPQAVAVLPQALHSA